MIKTTGEKLEEVINQWGEIVYWDRFSYEVLKRASRDILKAKTCDTCEYWDRTYFEEESNRGSCRNQKLFGCDGYDDDGFEEFEAAELHCGSKFGCIHHKQPVPFTIR